jgi:ribosomal protein S11
MLLIQTKKINLLKKINVLVDWHLKNSRTNKSKQKILKYNLRKWFVLLKNKSTQNNKIDLIFICKFLKSNIFFNVVDYKHQVLYVSSYGQMKKKGFEKQIKASLLHILKIGMLKINTNYNIAIHYKGLIKNHYRTYITYILKKNYSIKTIKSFNLLPHNGCRPKKIRRK